MPGFALLSANEKEGVGELGLVLAERYGIVSFGGTGTELARAGVDVLAPETVVDADSLPPDLPTLTERERRHVFAPLFARLMARSTDAVKVVYFNLLPPEEKRHDDGSYAGVKNDHGGSNIINAAIEAGRAVLTYPEQLPAFIERVGDPAYDLAADEMYLRTLGFEASRYLSNYQEHMGELAW